MAGLANKKRLVIILVTITLLFFTMILRIAWIQTVDGATLQQKALSQWTREITVKANRGNIVDCNGQVLAESSSVYTVALAPQSVEDADEVANKLAAILDMDAARIKELAGDKKKAEVWVKRQISDAQSEAIRSLDLPGVLLVLDTKRFYPQKDFLTQVLGFTSVDGEGQEGIELAYNKYLKGEDGKELRETDRDGNEVSYGSKTLIEAKDGNDVVLTIDYVIQYFLERAMDEAMAINNPKGITAIVMDPDTGAILAMGNKPDFDLNEVPRDDLDALRALSRNTAVADAFEMGSTFKTITLAAALEEGVVSESSGFHCSGSKIVDGIKTSCWKTHGSETLTTAVENSCNVAFMEMGLRLGIQKMYKYITAFGFGQKTSADFTSESTGIVQEEGAVKSFDLARISFGQSIAVTPLQLITAASAAINGGKLMQPYLVSAVRDKEGNDVVTHGPREVRRVVSEATSAEVRKLLESVVKNGSGRNAQIPGYRVGGKTGTAQKYANGKVAQGKNVASFIGFAPADDPEVIVLFIVDEPTGVSSTFGSVVAAPYAKAVLEDTLQYMGIEPDYGDSTPETKEVPDVRGMTVAEAKNKLLLAGLSGYSPSASGTVRSQMPQAGAKITAGSEVLLYTNAPGDTGDTSTAASVTVPYVIGLTSANATDVLEDAGLTVKLNGTGTVTAQSIAAGTRVPEGTQVRVTCGGSP